jgi:hypothetical protein
VFGYKREVVFASIFIIGVSLLLFTYWFRYTCLLILSARTTKDYASQIATANQLEFISTRESLMNENANTALDALHAPLDRDYTMLTYLLQHAASYKVAGQSVEQRIVMLDYHIMRIWFSVIRPFSQLRARRALLEMASIVTHLANTMGERVTLAARQ